MQAGAPGRFTPSLSCREPCTVLWRVGGRIWGGPGRWARVVRPALGHTIASRRAPAHAPPPLAHIRRATAPPAHNPRPARPPSPPYPTGRACVREAEEGSCGDSVPAAVRASALFAPTARPPAARGFAALEKTVLREITSGLFDDDDPEEAGDEDSVACLPALKATRSILRVRRSIDVEVRDQNALFFFSGWSRQTPGALPSGPACPPFCPRIAPGHPSDGESDLAVRALDGRGPGGRGGWRPQRGPDEHEKNHWRTPSLPSPLPRIADSFSPTRSR